MQATQMAQPVSDGECFRNRSSDLANRRVHSFRYKVESIAIARSAGLHGGASLLTVVKMRGIDFLSYKFIGVLIPHFYRRSRAIPI